MVICIPRSVYLKMLLQTYTQYNLFTDHNNLIINKIYTLCIKHTVHFSIRNKPQVITRHKQS